MVYRVIQRIKRDKPEIAKGCREWYIRGVAEIKGISKRAGVWGSAVLYEDADMIAISSPGKVEVFIRDAKKPSDVEGYDIKEVADRIVIEGFSVREYSLWKLKQLIPRGKIDTLVLRGIEFKGIKRLKGLFKCLGARVLEIEGCKARELETVRDMFDSVDAKWFRVLGFEVGDWVDKEELTKKVRAERLEVRW